jgi:hypothetical protein
MDPEFSSENLKGRGHLENVSSDRSIYLMDIKEIGWEDGDWIHLAQHRD